MNVELGPAPIEGFDVSPNGNGKVRAPEEPEPEVVPVPLDRPDQDGAEPEPVPMPEPPTDAETCGAESARAVEGRIMSERRRASPGR